MSHNTKPTRHQVLQQANALNYASCHLRQWVANAILQHLVCLQALNDSMFGNTECYEGEGLEEDDDEYAPNSKRQRAGSDSE